MRVRMWVQLFAFLVVAALAARAEAKHVRFLGPHPIAARSGGGYCYIEAPHMHVYGPDKPALYQQVGDEYVFTGDPTPFGYDGDKHPFYGHHPVLVEGSPEPVYCLIDGPHFHGYAAPETPDYRVKNGVAFYVAPIPEVYVKPHRVRVVNAEYRPYVSFRPVVEVAPPPEWRGDVYVAGPAVEVRTPGVYVAPPPRVEVQVRTPGVFIEPPAPRVVIGAPAPVFIGGGRHEERWEHHEGREHDDDEGEHEHEHHDNGRHEGWGKHGGREH